MKGPIFTNKDQHDNPSSPTVNTSSPYLRLRTEAEGPQEDGSDYAPGGFHPVAIGDLFQNGRFEIVNKLGYGGFATVWLALDRQQHRYVSIKIIIAELSGLTEHAGYGRACCMQNLKHDLISFPSEHFWHQGPNGNHLCLVSEPSGPSIAHLSGLYWRMHPRVAKKVLFQATQALAYLHSHQICHGDLTPRNILLPFSHQLDHLSIDELNKCLGEPRLFPAYSLYAGLGEDRPHIPAYAVEPVIYRSPEPGRKTVIKAGANIIDFDQSFHFDDPPREVLGTAPQFLAPEAIFELKAGWHSDIWALGCVIFQARAGVDPFRTFDGTTTETLRRMAVSLGDFPESWKAIKLDYEYGLPANGDEDGAEASVLDYWDILTNPLLEQIRNIKDAPVGIEKMNQSHHGCNETSWITRNFEVPIEDLDEDERWKYDQQPNITEQESTLLYDLLSRIFVYDPLKRLRAEQILEHAWFDDVRAEFENLQLDSEHAPTEKKGKKRTISEI